MSATVWSKVLQFFPTLLKGNSGAAPSINWNSGSVQSITLNAATVTPTFVNPVGGCNLALVITQDGTGGRAVTWPAAVSWIGGTPPILLSGAGQTTLVYFYWDGTTYWGSLQSGASPASIIPWTAVAAGTALAASLAKPNLAADSSGAQSTITLPTAAQMASSDGYEFTIKATGNMVAPVIVAAGAGTTLELLNAPGTFGASTWLPVQGQGVVFKYDKATTTWKARASSEGSGAAGTSAYNPTWYTKTDVYWDPVAGVDSDTGAVGHPLATAAEIIRRFGSTTPVLPYGQSLQIHQLTSQTIDTDVLTLNPVLSGGGSFSVIGTPTNRGAAFSPTTVSARVQTTAGSAFKLNGNLPAGLTVGDIIKNTTQNGYAVVQAIAGGNASLSQPFAAAGLTTIANFPALVEQNGWLNTDTYQALIPTSINLDGTNLQGGSASNPGGVYTTAWYQFLLVIDASGTSGDSQHTSSSLGPIVNYSLCTFAAGVNLSAANGSQNAMYSCGCLSYCDLGAGGQVHGGFVNGQCQIVDGAFAQIDSNAIFAAGLNFFVPGTLLGAALLLAASTFTIEPGACVEIINVGTGGGNLLYGPGTVNVLANAALVNASGGTWANCLKVANLKLDGAVTGWSPAAEGSFTLNGVTQVDVVGVNGTNAFPLNATIALSLKTVGATPGIVAPYFSAAQTQNNFHVKSGTALANDIFNWCALPASGVALSSANLDIFQSLSNPRTGARYAFA